MVVTMYRNGESCKVDRCNFKKMQKEGWKFYVNKEANVQEAEKEAEKVTEVSLTTTHKKALELGLEIYKENGELIHHKTLAKIIKEAVIDGNEN